MIKQRNRLALAISVGVMVLMSQAQAAKVGESREFTRADGVTVRQGAEWVSPPSIPSVLTVDMQRLPPAPEWKPGDPLIEIPRQFYGDINAPTPVPVNPVSGHDRLADLQRAFDRNRGESRSFTTPVQNFEGIRSTANPNDPTGDVGTRQFVMSINGSGGSQVAIYDKETGAQVGNNFSMSSLGSGGLCATAGAGDPIILFDELANRWVLTEFTGSGNLLCIYLSNTDDLSGAVTWTRYSFAFPAFPDYPKYGVWPDAYYVGANEGGTSGRRPFYAMDRVRMLAGEAATMQRLTVPNLAGFGFQMTQPADISGSNAPDPGTPGIFMRHRDDEAHNAGSNNATKDFLEMFQFTVDWTTPANSNIAGPISFDIAEFSSNLNGLSAFQAFPQPNGQRIDPLRETVMHRLVYRRFDTYEALVGNFVTDLFLGPGSIYPDDTGAVRWFELRRSLSNPDVLFRNGFEAGMQIEGNQAQWTLHQEGTFAPEDNPGVPADQADRWMAASNIDSAGNIGLAYNVVRQAPAISTGIRYTGRLNGDPLGVMTLGETVAVTGSGNTGTGTAAQRWGDYNDMGVDPVDGCTFWFVGNYANNTLNPTNSRANRVVAFKHDACGTPGFTLSAPVSTASVCAPTGTTVNAAPLTVSVGQISGFSGPVSLSFQNPPAGVTAGVTPSTVNPPGSTQVTLGANSAAAASNNIVLEASSPGATSRNVAFTLNVATAAPAAPAPSAPANGATAVSTAPTFSWAAVSGATGYVVEASTDPSFATLLFTQNVSGTSLLSPVTLPPGAQIHWRVRASNICGAGSNSTSFSFTTGNEFCRSPNIAIPDNNTIGVSDELVVSGTSGTVSNLDVVVDIDHTWVADLRLRLTRVSDGTLINLMTNPTNNPTGSCSGDNVRVTYDDQATIPAQSGCIANAVPTMEGLRIPQAALSAFNGQSLNGTWRLTVIDSVGEDTGTLLRWCLKP